MRMQNWAGNHTFAARRLHRPTTVEEVCRIVAGAERIRVLGSRHSFSDIADSPEMLTLEDLPPDIVVDHDAGTVSLSGAVRYGELANVLAGEGVALPNLASLPHISVAGAVATATHGSGNDNGNLATAVAALDLVTSDGQLLRFTRGRKDFDGIVVGLGALGAVTRLTLDVEPVYQVRQDVYEGLAWDALYGNVDAITSAGYSVSVFTRWGATVDQVWVKNRVTTDPAPTPEELFGAPAATVHRHPILQLDPVHCSAQLGEPGAWSDHLPHFRMGFTPSSGEELQAEFHIPRHHAVPALQAVHAMADILAPVLLVSELRTVAADQLWMSPQYDTDTLAIHFTLTDDQPRVEAVLTQVEAALAPFDPRPHWGKLFGATVTDLAPRYPRWEDFTDLVSRLDPRGAFRNTWLEERVLGQEGL